MQQLKRYLLISVGFISIMLGIIGIVLPLLPTTPFFILALACFARSSKKFHQQLLNNRFVGPLLSDWVRDKKIEKKRKQKILILVVVSFSFSILLLSANPLLQLSLLCLMLILLFFIYRIDER